MAAEKFSTLPGNNTDNAIVINQYENRFVEIQLHLL